MSAGNSSMNSAGPSSKSSKTKVPSEENGAGPTFKSSESKMPSEEKSFGPNLKTSETKMPSDENKKENKVDEKELRKERRFKHELEDEKLGTQFALQLLPNKFVSDAALFNILTQDLRKHYYVTKSWDPTFYAQLSYRGFVCVSMKMQDRNYLVPELQRHYCVMMLKETVSLANKCGCLHISKNARKRSKKYYLKISHDFQSVWKGLEDLHKADNWVIKAYQNLFKNLAEYDEKEDGVSVMLDKTKAFFRPVSVELFDLQGNLAAGEFGYTIGSTYTSLSGFCIRERRFNGAGIVQLCCLGRVLEKKGYRLWNLGHPYKAGKTADKALMMYKKEIGSNVVSRVEFLSMWSEQRDTEGTERLLGSYSCKTLMQKIP